MATAAHWSVPVYAVQASREPREKTSRSQSSAYSAVAGAPEMSRLKMSTLEL